MIVRSTYAVQRQQPSKSVSVAWGASHTESTLSPLRITFHCPSVRTASYPSDQPLLSITHTDLTSCSGCHVLPSSTGTRTCVSLPLRLWVYSANHSQLRLWQSSLASSNQPLTLALTSVTVPS
eukprot:PhF_6_TR27923/c0_g1_i1/m.41083